MAEKGQVYKCDKCDNVVEVLRGGEGELVCCGEAMNLLSDDEASVFLTPPGMKPGSP